MADPRQSYLQQLRAYAQPLPTDIPASVRTYSVFDPNSNTWRRMTNDGRSPIPAQGQAVVPVQAPAQPAVDPVVAALAMAQQTRGRDWSRPLPQTPAQMPSGGSVRPSPASGGGGAVPVQGQPSRASQRAVEAPTASAIPEIPEDVSVRAPAELYQGAGIAPDGTVVNYNFTDESQTAQSKPTINTQEIGQMFQPQGQRVPPTPNVGAGLSRGTANYTNPRAPRVFDPMRRVTTYVPAPETPVQIIRPLANTPASSVRLALPPGTGAIPMGRTPTIIRSPMEMTTPSGLARWQYRLDQLSGLGR